MNNNKRLYCPKCKKIVKGHENIVLDILNTITHKECYHLGFALKDYGSFKKVAEKYDFFDDIKR
ncbi:hypothetical protein [Virgibacillus doumboii]|uniref:hypothetical protein n=1 Tax=Virgibacillus doumboii TaxID=2697503 RepID=UPI0013E000A4|nr:hypothetical protein [Virgibacillus doumboii]